MKCPKCKTEDIELNIVARKKFVEAEAWCPICEEIVAFYRIEDGDWITED